MKGPHQRQVPLESRYRAAVRAQLESQFPGALGGMERDACGIIARVRKSGKATHGNLVRTLEALACMAHRSGEVRGEGDGCGVMTDLPRELWAQHLLQSGLDPTLAADPRFFVGHFFYPQGHAVRELLDLLRVAGSRYRLQILLERQNQVYSRALGPLAQLTAPQFVQVAGLLEAEQPGQREAALYRLGLELEAAQPVHVVSLSARTVVYKVRASAEVLPRYYPELNSPLFTSMVTIGHNRYSTNTLSTFEQVQPFTLLAHNGEINTISRLRREGLQLGIPLTGGSDSQDLNRILSGYIFEHGLSPLEAAESVFPPVLSEVRSFSSPQQEAYMGLRAAGGPLAQGPAAIIARQADELVCAVDALGLRPLWFGETEKEYFWSSERGVIPLGEMVRDPAPLSPGEKMVVQLQGGQARIHANEEVQRLVLHRVHDRASTLSAARSRLDGPHWPLVEREDSYQVDPPRRVAFGLEKWDEGYLGHVAEAGAEPISSLGYDGQLPALRGRKPNLAEFFKETVAVVTNPAIDREREIEHFSTRTLVGPRPNPTGSDHSVELLTPLLAPNAALARMHRTLTLASLQAELRSVTLVPSLSSGQTLQRALEELGRQALEAVMGGAELLILDDTSLYQGGQAAIDIVLALGWLEQQLLAPGDQGLSWRRRCGLVVRSAQARNLHDLMVLLGLGAEAVEPYLIYALHQGEEARGKLLTGLTKGIEKVMSTMGIHELRGYGQTFTGIGLAKDLAAAIGTRSIWGEARGYGLADLEQEILRRLEAAQRSEETPERDVRFNPRLFKAAFAMANGELEPADYAARVQALEAEMPLAARQLLSFERLAESEVDADEVDLAVGGHSLPFVISGMSFGSQGETAFRSYAEAAKELNILAMNGEGGEIPDMIGRYPHWRGQQVASGRFGVSSRMLNSATVIEIKVGQGAKPGEGGHLPGKKVTEKIAHARHATPGIDLISPSNNHDVYSIEDLAQLIEELRTINPTAKIGVKIPVVEGVGTIALGVAKAGANIITLSGFEGGTGAARAHALKYAGMPVEYGVQQAHRSLTLAGLRERVELWADGGLKTALDVARMVALGADRIGFGTLSMVAIGCTICRGCQLDTCHVGIATQVESEEDAQRHGMKRWVPRNLPDEVQRLVNFYGGLAKELRGILASLGLREIGALRGRADLLHPGSLAIDFSDLLSVAECKLPAHTGRLVIHRSLNSMTKMISEWLEDFLEEGEVVYRDGPVVSSERALGTHLVGTLTRHRRSGVRDVRLHFEAGSIPGNGLGAFNDAPVEILVDGGAQDGVGKSSLGGRITVLKGRNHQGQRIDGSVGKSFGYGAIGGRFLIQGDADSRFCVRLSGADVVLGGELRPRVDDSLGMLATRANIKGFAFEYMTAGRAVVLGDPGPWICSGMSGGVVYLRHAPRIGLDDAALQRRLAKGAAVRIHPLHAQGVADVRELLTDYHQALIRSEQLEAARRVAELLVNPSEHFRMVLPAAQQVDPRLSTE